MHGFILLNGIQVSKLPSKRGNFEKFLHLSCIFVSLSPRIYLAHACCNGRGIILSEMWYLLFFLFSFFFFFESAINSRHELFINRELKLGNIYRSSSKLISGFHRVPCNEHQSSIKRRNSPAVRCFHVLVHYQTDSIFMLKVRTSKTGDYFQ